MPDVLNRDNLYATPRVAVHDEPISRRHWAVEAVCSAIRAVLDMLILLLMLLTLTVVFDLLQGEARASLMAPGAFVAALIATIWLRQRFVADAGTWTRE